jgi:hypothetical protein
MASALDEIKESNKSLVKQLSNTTLPIDNSSEEIKVVYSNDDEDASLVHDLSASCQKVFNAILKAKLTENFPNQSLTNIETYRMQNPEAILRIQSINNINFKYIIYIYF